MTERENKTRAIRFGTPDYIPMTFHINGACWQHYDQQRLFDLMEQHPFLFPDFRRPQGVLKPQFAAVAQSAHPFTDDWGCVWETSMDGITGTVTKHPLADWSAFAAYRAPDAQTAMGIGPVDWAAERAQVEQERQNGAFVFKSLRHGHTFLQLCDIRGYENLLYDMMDETDELPRLVDMIEQFNAAIVRHYIGMNVDMIGFAEDLGMQSGPMISPELFRRYITPSYRRLIAPVREAGIMVHMHSDGHLHALLDDILASGVEVMNLQDLVNGIDWIHDNLAGKVCIELDLDRQFVTPNGTPAQIDALVREEVEKLSTPEGGLMMIYGLYPGLPYENIKAVMDAMERYAFYHR